jgi:photosystem II stability/assembly factor-like uncharacterized protein
MRKRLSFGSVLIIVLFSLVHNTDLFSQNGWYYVNPLPGGDDFSSAIFVNSNTGFVSGSFASILKTTNGGGNWSKIGLPVNYSSTFVTVVNTNTVYAGCGNYVCRSTDLGNTWGSYNLDSGWVRSISFSGPSTGITVCQNGKIFRTSNSGLNWNTVFDNQTFGWGSQIINDTGYVCCSQLYKTVNGGLNWSSVNDTSLQAMNVSFINGKTGFICGAPRSHNYISKTTNGGINWIPIPVNLNNFLIIAIYAQDENNIIACSSSGKIYKTNNGGIIWNEIFDAQTPLYNINKINQNELFVTGSAGLYKTSNFGSTWQSLIMGYKESLYNIKVINQNIIYACGEKNRIIKSVDGGNSWVSVSGSNKAFEFTEFRDMYFLNESTGFVIGDSSKILKTTNGGTNWELINLPLFFPTCISFLNPVTGIIIGAYGKTLKTTNSGNDWFVIHEDNLPSVWKIQMVNQNLVFATSLSVLKSTDGGSNWIDINPSVNWGSKYFGLHFLNENTGFVTSDSGYICKTTNGGNNWTSIRPENYTSIYSIKFADSQTGYAAGTNGKILKTTNGGTNWALQPQTTSNNIINLDFINPNTGFVCGGKGTILKTTTGGSVGIIAVNNNVPISYGLEQNYPNPFNPSTKIRYSLKENSFVTLKVSDVLGRTISFLVNQNQNAGEYEVTFNGEKFSSGIYFYSFSANNFVKTKRMVLVK